ncbi:MAG: hypothetical protein JWQ35_2364 [Bacteriovoracaceae bacterium]|nr:hypothetical protein [Bacteriovoracaceae bacterium]
MDIENKTEKRIKAEFFRSAAGNESVREELLNLGRPIKTVVGEDILFIEQNWPLDRPYADLLKRGRGQMEQSIYEARHTVEKSEFRTLFFVYEDRMVLTHFIKKKSNKTPKDAIELAWKRMKLWMQAQRELEKEK